MKLVVRSAIGTPGAKAVTGRLILIPPTTRVPTVSSSSAYHPIGAVYPGSLHGHLRPALKTHTHAHTSNVGAMSFIILIDDSIYICLS